MNISEKFELELELDTEMNDFRPWFKVKVKGTDLILLKLNLETLQDVYVCKTTKSLTWEMIGIELGKAFNEYHANQSSKPKENWGEIFK